MAAPRTGRDASDSEMIPDAQLAAIYKYQILLNDD